jgi:hypothetical protein
MKDSVFDKSFLLKIFVANKSFPSEIFSRSCLENEDLLLSRTSNNPSITSGNKIDPGAYDISTSISNKYANNSNGNPNNNIIKNQNTINPKNEWRKNENRNTSDKKEEVNEAEYDIGKLLESKHLDDLLDEKDDLKKNNNTKKSLKLNTKNLRKASDPNNPNTQDVITPKRKLDEKELMQQHLKDDIKKVLTQNSIEKIEKTKKMFTFGQNDENFEFDINCLVKIVKFLNISENDSLYYIKHPNVYEIS